MQSSKTQSHRARHLARVAPLLLTLALPASAATQWPSRELRDRESGAVEGVTFSPDGTFLASADKGGTMIVRMFPGPRVFATLKGGSFTSAAWSPDGETLVAGSIDGGVFAWPRPPGDETVRNLPYDAPVHAVAVSPSGVILAGGGGDWAIRRWQLPKFRELDPFRGHTDDVYAIAASRDGLIASGGKDRTIRVWDPAGNQSRTLRGRDDSVYGLVFSPDGTLLASSYGDGTVALWNTHSWRVASLMPGPSRPVRRLAVSRDGRWLAGAGLDKEVWVWSLRDTTPPLLLDGHRGKVNAVAFGRGLASAANDTSVRLWSVP